MFVLLLPFTMAQINPHWSDERLYQEGRRVMGAVFQHITYNEFLPRIIGLNARNLYDLSVRTEGYSNDYDPTCNGRIQVSTAAKLLQFLHN